MSYSDDWTDAQLAKAEKSIKSTYKKAWQDLKVQTKDYFTKFEARDNAMKDRLDAGEITTDYYTQWRKNQIMRGDRWKALTSQAADRMNQANEVAAAYVNDRTPGIYSLNHNYECYLMEGDASAKNQSISLTVYNEQAVKRLTSGKQQQITPKYKYRTCQPDGTAWKAWNQRQLQKCVASAIIRGATLKDMSEEFQRVLGMDQASALRNARTSWTSAQQAGRYEAQQQAAAMGLNYKRKWICVKDDRTRNSHREMDLQIRELDEAFTTPGGASLMYPGDPSGPASEVYNCRCTVCTVDPMEDELPVPKKIRVRDADGNNVVVEDMNYTEWNEWKTTGKLPVRAAKTETPVVDALHPASLGGAKRGAEMSFAEADTYKTNPKYTDGRPYHINCQTCVVAFEARQRGYNVIATGNTNGSVNERVSSQTNLAWIDPETGEHPKYLFNQKARGAKQMYSWIDSTVKQGERYTIEFFWKGGRGGHIINLDRDDDGRLRLHDNQRGEGEENEWVDQEKVVEYLKRTQIYGTYYSSSWYRWNGKRYDSGETYTGIMLLRVDNCKFDESICNEILEAASE